MHLLFVKLHLIVFEIVSFILLISIFGSLFYYSVIFRNLPAMRNEDNIEMLNVLFTANFSKGVFADVDIKIYEVNSTQPENPQKACVLYSKSYYDDCDGDSKKIIEKMTNALPNNIFFFENEALAENFKHHLINLKSESSTFNLTLFTLISLFLIFIKITLLKDSIVRLRKIKSSKSDGKNEVHTNLLAQIHPEEYSLASGKEEPKNLYYNPVLSFLNPINVYYYVIFHLTIVIIIPLIFPNYIEFYVVSYIGFMSNMYYSIYYGRSLFGNDLLRENKKIDLHNFIITEITKDSSRKKYNRKCNKNNPTNINPYMVNLLIMCGSIWLSQLFHPFNSQTSVKIVDVDLKKGKLKKYMKICSIIAVFGIWGFFIILGLLYQIDLLYLYHKLLFNNIKRLFDVKIPIFIGLVYYHIYFYAIMGIYTYQTYKKNKFYEGKQKIVYNWFS